MRTCAVVLSSAVLSCSAAFAQVTGTFYMDKDVIALGQTAVVRFKVMNSGQSAYMLDTTGLPGQPLCAGYSIKVLRQPNSSGAPSTMSPKLIRANTCILNGKISHIAISPGASYIQDIDLSLYLDLRVNGNYMIEASHNTLRRNGTPPDSADTKARLHFRVE